MMQRVMIVNCFETYEQRVELLCDYFKQNRYEVKVITSDWYHMHKTVRQDCPEGYEMVHVKPYRKNLSPRRLMSHDGFAKAAQKKMEEYRPDLLWVLVPPNSLAKTAGLYKKRHPEVKLVLDLIDMWPETMPIAKFKYLPPFSLWRDLRNNYVEYADLLVTECDLYQNLLIHVTQKPMKTLYLARKFVTEIPIATLASDRIGLCYLGSINNIIDISCIASVIQRINVPVDLHIIGDGENRDKLIATVQKVGAKVHFYGKIYDLDKKLEIINQCHMGLNIMKPSVFVGLTMKSIDYFELSLPILNTIQGDTWRFVEENDIGINITPTADLSVANIMRLQDNRDKVHEFAKSQFDIGAFSRNLSQIMEVLGIDD